MARPLDKNNKKKQLFINQKVHFWHSKELFQNWVLCMVKNKHACFLLVDMVSAPFLMSRIHLYDKYDDPTNFFRPSVRSLLVS